MSDQYSAKPWIKNYDKHVPSELVYPDAPLIDVIRKTGMMLPDRVAIYHLDNGITFKQLDEMSNRFANFLMAQGLQKGNVVGIYMPNLPGCIISFLGIQKIGCVMHGISSMLTEEELKYQLNDSGAKALATFDMFLPKAAKVAPSTMVKTIVATGLTDFTSPSDKAPGAATMKLSNMNTSLSDNIAVFSLERILHDNSADPIKIRVDPGDLCALLYTGGTTGPSKGAMLTNRNIVSQLTQFSTWVNSKMEEEMGLSPFPFFHTSGFLFGIFGLANGVTQILVPNPRDYQFLIDTLSRYPVTAMSNVLTGYMELMKRPDFKALDHGRVKFWISGAAPFPDEYIKLFREIAGKTIMETYGMTECGIITCDTRYGLKKAGSVGLPLPDLEVKVIDTTTGDPIKLGEPGELCIRGPQVMKGYLNKPEETSGAINDGWLHTGDIVIMDEDGYIFVVDRVKDMVSVSGLKVFTKELDDIICTYPDVAMAASVGIPNPERPFTEIVASAIILKKGVEPSEEEKKKIVNFLKEKVAPYKVPRKVVFMESLPVSGIGKVLKRELRIILK